MTGMEAHVVLKDNCSVDVGKFYGAATGLGLGAGLIYTDVRSPAFDEQESLFLTVEQPAYVVTHECDVDEGNQRAFSDYLLICPIIALEDFLAEYQAEFDDEIRLRNFLTSVAKRLVNRVVYLPPGPGPLQLGGFVYLNNLTSTHVSVFSERQPLVAVSAYGLREVDSALTNHLLRPKDDALSLTTGGSKYFTGFG